MWWVTINWQKLIFYRYIVSYMHIMLAQFQSFYGPVGYYTALAYAQLHNHIKPETAQNGAG